MNVQIKTVRLATYQPNHGWRDGAVNASADGCPVSYYRRHGWCCKCGQEGRCEHIDAVAALIHPDTIAGIDERRRQMEPRLARPLKEKAAEQ